MHEHTHTHTLYVHVYTQSQKQARDLNWIWIRIAGAWGTEGTLGMQIFLQKEFSANLYHGANLTLALQFATIQEPWQIYSACASRKMLKFYLICYIYACMITSGMNTYIYIYIWITLDSYYKLVHAESRAQPAKMNSGFSFKCLSSDFLHFGFFVLSRPIKVTKLCCCCCCCLC